jgi:sarcosine/dimethylglycine N-methyltransferase
MSENLVQTTKAYYDSDSADNFYHTIWGGEDIHVGLYQHDKESIFDASARTVERMIGMVPLTQDSHVLDVGAGYGGAGRHIARKIGCKVTCQNLSEAENRRNEEKNKAQGLDHLIDVVGGNFEELPFQDKAFDIVWSEDALLHSSRRDQVLAEVARVLQPGGHFIFTDPMQADNVTGQEEALQPIYKRIHLESLGSVKKYREMAQAVGLEAVAIEEMPEQLTRHYSRVLEEVERRYDEVLQVCDQEYIDNMRNGLKHWVNGGKQGILNWGILHFRKPT